MLDPFPFNQSRRALSVTLTLKRPREDLLPFPPWEPGASADGEH